VGTVFQAAFSVVMLIIWLWTKSEAAMASLWALSAGVPLWMMVAILFYCRQLAKREALEIEEISARGGEQAALFERQDELELRPAARRLAWTERWISPAFTLLWAGAQITAGVLVARHLSGTSARTLVSPGQGFLFPLLTGFMAFLLSYYCLGMAGRECWRVLRATGSYLLINALCMGGVAGALIAYWQGYRQLDRIVAWAVPVAQLVLSVELLLNFVLDIYRPRVPGQEHRFSFDSRLFNLIAEPGKVGHSIAETINYQFGFEVSKTWFYQLVSRAAVPLLLGGVAMMLATSSILIVREGQVCIVRHWGSLDRARGPLGPGLHVKWPWPIDTTEHYDVAKVHEFLLGAGEERAAEEIRGDYVNGKQVFLWTKAHGERKELDFLLAVPPKQGSADKGKKPPPPVNIIKLIMFVRYVVTDVYDYGYRFTDTHKALECMAYRELTRYFASATLDSAVGDGGEDRPQAIMTFGRQQAASKLRDRIQAVADSLGMGVKITKVGFLTVHPPPDAAPEFEKVLKAKRAQEQQRFQAEADAYRTLARYAGSSLAALRLALAIQKLDELDELNRVRGRPDVFNETLRRYVHSAQESIDKLNEEVAQQRLMGKLSAERLTDKEQLRDAYAQYLALLGKLRPDGGMAEAVASAVDEADKLFGQAVGEPAAMVARAQAARWERELAGRAEWEALENRKLAFEANPLMYMWDRWLAVWDEAMPKMHKYILAVDRDRVEVWLDWHREPSALESAVEFTGTKPQPRQSE